MWPAHICGWKTSSVHSVAALQEWVPDLSGEVTTPWRGFGLHLAHVVPCLLYGYETLYLLITIAMLSGLRSVVICVLMLI